AAEHRGGEHVAEPVLVRVDARERDEKYGEERADDHRDPRWRRPARRRDAYRGGERDGRIGVTRRHREIARVGPAVQEVPVPWLSRRDERTRAPGKSLHDAADRTRHGDRLGAAKAEQRNTRTLQRAAAEPEGGGEVYDTGSAPPVEGRADRVQRLVLLEGGALRRERDRAVQIIHRIAHVFTDEER